jgi:hypothetical protein
MSTQTLLRTTFMREPRNRLVQIGRFGGPAELEVIDAPCRRPAAARYGSACSPQAWSTPML